MSPCSRRKPVASSPRLMSAARSSPAFIIGMFSIAVRLIVRIAATRLLYLKLSQNRFRKARGAFRGCHYYVGCDRAHPVLVDCGDVAAGWLVWGGLGGRAAVKARERRVGRDRTYRRGPYV